MDGRNAPGDHLEFECHHVPLDKKKYWRIENRISTRIHCKPGKELTVCSPFGVLVLPWTGRHQMLG